MRTFPFIFLLQRKRSALERNMLLDSSIEPKHIGCPNLVG